MNEENETKSVVEIDIGQNRIRIEATEKFITDELHTILQWTTDSIQELGIDESKGVGTIQEETKQAGPEDIEEQPEREGIGAEEDDSATKPSGAMNEVGEKIREIANRLNVDPQKLSEYFYIDEEGAHIRDPMNIEPEYALLGYGLIEKERTGEAYLNNRETKQILIDREMMDIDRWGGKFLYNLRRQGVIKDDPNSDKSRNKPFKITPKGHRNFVQWLQKSE